MNDTEKTKDETKAAGEDWAVLPFDEQEDDARWDKLISEIDDLAERAAATESVGVEILTDGNLSDDEKQASASADENEDDELSAMNPF